MRAAVTGPQDEGSRSLEGTELFQLLDPARIELIRPHASLWCFDEGEHIYLESQPAAFLWAVRSGEIRTLRGDPNGRVTTLETLRPGDLFGMAAIADSARYAESAQAVTPGEAWRIPRRVVASMLRAEPELARLMLAIVASRLQRAHERLCSFAHGSVRERMARVLLESDSEGRIETTRRLLGERAGTTVETSIRVLRRFEQSGWIESGTGWVRVLDRSALEEVAAGKQPGR